MRRGARSPPRRRCGFAACSRRPTASRIGRAATSSTCPSSPPSSIACFPRPAGPAGKHGRNRRRGSPRPPTPRLIGEATLGGEATLQVFHAGGGPRTLSLEPCNLALSKVRWTAADPAKPAAPAAIGSDNDGKLQAVVDRGGSLGMAWSLAGRRDADATDAFALELPPSPVCRFSLDLPLGMTPTVDRGIVLGSRPAGEEMRRWEIELGGHNRFHLRVAPSDAVGRAKRLAVARQSMVYDVSLRGVEISAQWKLEAYDEPLRQATFRLDPQVRLVNVALRRRSRPLVGRVAAGQPDDARRRHAAGADSRRRRVVAAAGAGALGDGRAVAAAANLCGGDVLGGRRRDALDRRAAGGGAADSHRLPANGGRSAADAADGRVGAVRLLLARRHRRVVAGAAPRGRPRARARRRPSWAPGR